VGFICENDQAVIPRNLGEFSLDPQQDKREVGGETWSWTSKKIDRKEKRETHMGHCYRMGFH